MLQKELEIFKENGLEASEVSKLPILVQFVFAIKVEEQIRFNPATYLNRLASNLADKSCNIFEETTVIRLRAHKGYCLIETNHRCSQLCYKHP